MRYVLVTISRPSSPFGSCPTVSTHIDLLHHPGGSVPTFSGFDARTPGKRASRASNMVSLLSAVGGGHQAAVLHDPADRSTTDADAEERKMKRMSAAARTSSAAARTSSAGAAALRAAAATAHIRDCRQRWHCRHCRLSRCPVRQPCHHRCWARHQASASHRHRHENSQRPKPLRGARR